MKYEKAQNILPQDIIKLIQQYMDGGYLYIPRKSESKKSWGENSGIKSSLKKRNNEIYNKYSSIKRIDYLYFTEKKLK